MTNAITPQSAYPTAEQVMNRARAFVNDAFRGGKGRILTDQAPFTIEYLNAALEELQDKIGNNGVITLLRDNVILGPITSLPASNPAIQIFIAYEGFFNGTTMLPLPVIPSDCRAVIKLWQRQVGTNLPFFPMMQPQQGLESVYQGQYLNMWEYRQDRIYLTGARTNMELRMRYEARQPVITDASALADTQIGILSSVNSLATVVGYVYARARGAAAMAVMQTDGEKQMRYIVRRYTRRRQGINYNRMPYGVRAGGNQAGNGNQPL